MEEYGIMQTMAYVAGLVIGLLAGMGLAGWIGVYRRPKGFAGDVPFGGKWDRKTVEWSVRMLEELVNCAGVQQLYSEQCWNDILTAVSYLVTMSLGHLCVGCWVRRDERLPENNELTALLFCTENEEDGPDEREFLPGRFYDDHFWVYSGSDGNELQLLPEGFSVVAWAEIYGPDGRNLSIDMCDGPNTKGAF